MGFFDRKLKDLENMEVDGDRVNMFKSASDKAADIVRELSGVNDKRSKKIIDNVILFTNAAGGAGASTIASNVAFMASKQHLNVLVIDLNVMMPIQHTYLGIAQELKKDDLISFLCGDAKLSDCIDTSNKDINLLYANNRTLSDDINSTTKIEIENFKTLLTNVKKFYDLVIIDCPMRIDNLLCNTAMYEADAIYTVWEEGAGSIINTEKIRRNMALSGVDSFTKMRIILNKRTSIHFSDYSIKKLNLELVEVLPFDIDVIDNSLRGKIFCDKGVATSKNAVEFINKIERLTDKILKIGGYVK